MDPVADLAFFSRLLQCGSLTATAQQLGITPPAVSRRLSALEQRLGVRLVNRTTRTLALTAEGERYLARGRPLLAELLELEQELSAASAAPQGLLRVNATLGFGRRHIAPAVSAFVRAYPQVQVQLQLSDRMPALSDGSFDVSIRFGAPPDARIVARRIAANRRILCAAPGYLARHPAPTEPAELRAHQCIVVRENDDIWGNWVLHSGSQVQTVKVAGALSSNDGETAVNWALDGHGVLLRSLWDVTPYLHSGRLRQLLPAWSGAPADIWALYPSRLGLSARVRCFVDYLVAHFDAAVNWQGA
ncbi:LysR family transcriptional regulator [Vogesella facilis]|uniref:LysR family transcriptional regulator n=1 Tax=Vogesella facilis TaxID=1655232 RepID=A0ABV7RAZ2_9NEIS